MGRWKTSQIMSGIAKFYNKSTNPTHISTISVLQFKPPHYFITSPPPPIPRFQLFNLRPFSALPCPSTTIYGNEYDEHHFDQDYLVGSKDDQESGSIPVRAFFLCTGIDLKSMQAENSSYVVPPSTRSSNYIALRFGNLSSDSKETEIKENVSDFRYMVVYQYGSAVLFNIEEHEVDSYLELVRRHASGILQESRKDDYAVKENTLLAEDMQGGADYIVLKNLDIDSIRVIGSVLGQSIALDYFVSQVDGMLEEFTGINRGMEKTGTFTMERKKLFQLVGKANSTMADVILRVGLFERSDIAWRDAKYAQIFEYLREEYEVTQRFGNLDFKLKFVEHNVHFLQEVLQNRKSDLLEWCIILLLSIENIIGLYEIFCESTAISF